MLSAARSTIRAAPTMSISRGCEIVQRIIDDRDARIGAGWRSVPLIEAAAVDPIQPQSLMNTTPIPTGDTDIHAGISAQAEGCRS